eukprot:11952432-Alexandrium_andersonii.AAC.1
MSASLVGSEMCIRDSICTDVLDGVVRLAVCRAGRNPGRPRGGRLPGQLPRARLEAPARWA